MIEILQKQYALLQGSRGVVLNFIETQVRDDLNTEVPAYENQTIRILLEHTAACYFHWLAYFALDQPIGSINDQGFTTVDLIRQLYRQVDDIVNTFFESFDGRMDIPVTAVHSSCGLVSATPAQLFTHVLTHEFHHKGQIMLMCRILDYIPPDTDVSGFFVKPV